MKVFLSPKDLAEAIGVSESSLKRWADDGRLRAVRTAGGHRRIPLPEAVRYIRETRCQILRPDVLGLGVIETGPANARTDSAEDRFCRALQSDDTNAAKGILFSEFLAGRSIAELCDGPIRHAMTLIGDLWKHGPDGIVIEHRAFDTCLQALVLLRSALPDPRPDAPLALGCAPQADPYMLTTIAAATVAAEAGFRAVNLGADTPFEVLATAVTKYLPRLVWVSSSVQQNSTSLGARLRGLASRPEARGVHIMVGGRGTRPQDVPVCANLSWGSSLSELGAFAKGLAVSVG